jgi:hypothetical protein
MEMSDPHRSLSRREEKSLLRIAAAATRSEFGIPERTGCPHSETLKSLAGRQPSPPETPDLIDHIGTCSPCFIEYSRYRTIHKHRVRILYALACAGVLLVCFTAVRSLHTPIGRPSPPGTEIASSQELVLDLRMKGVSRSDNPDKQGDGTIPRLPRTRLSLSIQLPVGSEDGTYDVALVNSLGQSVVEARGEAKLQSFVEVLPVQVNLADLAPGLYQLRLRRAQTHWSSYLVVIE